MDSAALRKARNLAAQARQTASTPAAPSSNCNTWLAPELGTHPPLPPVTVGKTPILPKRRRSVMAGPDDMDPEFKYAAACSCSTHAIFSIFCSNAAPSHMHVCGAHVTMCCCLATQPTFVILFVNRQLQHRAFALVSLAQMMARKDPGDVDGHAMIRALKMSSTVDLQCVNSGTTPLHLAVIKNHTEVRLPCTLLITVVCTCTFLPSLVHRSQFYSIHYTQCCFPSRRYPRTAAFQVPRPGSTMPGTPYPLPPFIVAKYPS